MAAEGFESLLNDFLLESRERINRVEEFFLACEDATPATRKEHLIEARRELHTLKGNSGMMGFMDLRAAVHQLEDQIATSTPDDVHINDVLAGLDQLRDILETAVSGASDVRPDASSASQQQQTTIQHATDTTGSIRVPFASLDTLMDLLAEMVIFRNRLTDAVSRGKASSHHQSWEEVEQSQESLNKTLSFLQQNIMNLRMVPLRTLFGSLKRIVHDESVKEEKQVHLETAGGDTPMDKALLEVANEALGHLVRNAIVHGIEPPAVREAKRKPKAGKITISATIHSNEVEVEVRDDGAGVDREALIQKAKERGIDVTGIDDLRGLLLLPGLSTREESDMSSGRGMGLSAAMSAVQKMGGRLDVSSSPNQGTTFHLRLPLSVSIARALIVSADGETYALPMHAIVASHHFKQDETHQVNQAGVFRWRKKMVTLLDAGFIFGTTRESRKEGYVIILEVDRKHRGLIVDQILGIREIVVKTLDPVCGNLPGIAGSTILGDGRVVLILDPYGLMLLRPFMEESA